MGTCIEDGIVNPLPLQRGERYSVLLAIVAKGPPRNVFLSHPQVCNWTVLAFPGGSIRRTCVPYGWKTCRSRDKARVENAGGGARVAPSFPKRGPQWAVASAICLFIPAAHCFSASKQSGILNLTVASLGWEANLASPGGPGTHESCSFLLALCREAFPDL